MDAPIIFRSISDFGLFEILVEGDKKWLKILGNR